MVSGKTQILALIQRVAWAHVEVGEERVGEIGAGLLVLAASEPDDTPARVQRIAERLLGYRVFADAQGKMNRSLTDIGGGLLLVSQFTLAADTSSGARPSFSSAAAPAVAEPLFDALVAECRARHAGRVETGRFRTHMVVSLANDGPVTFLLRA